MQTTTRDKLHIFLIMFFISLIMSVQAPIFTPYAAQLGASSVMIGVMLSVAQLASLTGNLFSGPLVDRFGKKRFITIPLLISGVLFITHGFVTNTASLLILRMLNGLTMAFLLPAALALLSSYATNRQQQGKNMAINGMLGTIASIIAPLIGGRLGVTLGYVNTYFIIGLAMLLTGIYTLQFLHDRQMITIKSKRVQQTIDLKSLLAMPSLHIVFLTGFALMYIHGVIIYEIPYLTVEQGLSTIYTGIYFSVMALGTFLSLSFFFLNRLDPIKRILFGLFGICLSIFAIFNGLFGLPLLLFLVGFFFGIIMPAIPTLITDTVSKTGHGRAFGVMSAIYSSGMIVGSFVTGIIRDIVSPYFLAFLVGMLVLSFAGFLQFREAETTKVNIYEN